MKFNNMSMGTSLAQDSTPQLCNKDGLMKYVNWNLSAIKNGKSSSRLERNWYI